ncbi:uncharacterized protein LOC128849497 [Cuculus canorus]|uniref:uncharacterized protein LOC128849497 n=1 Tax=Cuculus canorus TaxID=55661 RepID=UPI0023AA8709|nr:uncharacterized protein LOC128849497 [Cuculus canorus]
MLNAESPGMASCAAWWRSLSQVRSGVPASLCGKSWGPSVTGNPPVPAGESEPPAPLPEGDWDIGKGTGKQLARLSQPLPVAALALQPELCCLQTARRGCGITGGMEGGTLRFPAAPVDPCLAASTALGRGNLCQGSGFIPAGSAGTCRFPPWILPWMPVGWWEYSVVSGFCGSSGAQKLRLILEKVDLSACVLRNPERSPGTGGIHGGTFGVRVLKRLLGWRIGSIRDLGVLQGTEPGCRAQGRLRTGHRSEPAEAPALAEEQPWAGLWRCRHREFCSKYFKYLENLQPCL